MSKIVSLCLLCSTCFFLVTSDKFGIGTGSSKNVYPLDDLVDDFMEAYSFTNNGTWPNNDTIVKPCAAFLNAYAEYTSNFTRCLVENARPFRLCETCVEPFTKASAIFNDLNDKSNPCFHRLLSADRVQVIRFVSNNMQTMWTIAECTKNNYVALLVDCFSSVTEDPRSGEVNVTLSNSTKEFLLLFKNLSLCLNTTIEDPDLTGTNNISWCDKCRVHYKALNKLFDSIQDSTTNHACMDVMDMMNYTRIIWSKRYHCSHRKGDKIPVLVLATFVCLLPIIFYVGQRLYGGRYEKQIMRQKRMHRPVESSYGSTSYIHSTDSSNDITS